MLKKVVYIFVLFVFAFFIGQFFIMGSINKTLFYKITKDTSIYDVYNISFKKGFLTSEAEFKVALYDSSNQNDDLKIKMIFNNNIFSKNLLEGFVVNPYVDSEIKDENLAKFSLNNSLFGKNLLSIKFVDIKINKNGKVVLNKPILNILLDKKGRLYNLDFNIEKTLVVDGGQLFEMEDFNYQLNFDKGLVSIVDIKDLNDVLVTNKIDISKLKISDLVLDKLKLNWDNKISTTNDTYDLKLNLNIYSLILPKELQFKKSINDISLKFSMNDFPLIYPDAISTMTPKIYLTLISQAKSSFSIDELSCNIDNKNIYSNIDFKVDSKDFNAKGNIVANKDIIKELPKEFSIYFIPKDDNYVLDFSFTSLNFSKNILKINGQVIRF